MLNRPLVSILINNYNYGRFLGEAIESALNQTYTEREVIVVDDGSTDNSRQVISGYGDRIIPVLKENGGQASAFNAGFAASRGEIICFLDSDDIFCPEKVEKIVAVYTTFHDIGWCYHAQELFPVKYGPSALNERQNYDMSCSRRYDLRTAMKCYRQKISPPATSGLTFRSDILAQMLPMQEAASMPISDDHYLKYVAFSLAPGYYIAEKLSRQRIHDSNYYTMREDNSLIADKKWIFTALAIRERFPHLKRFTNNLFAKGLSGGQTVSALEDYIGKYYSKLSLPERLEVRVLKKLHRVRQKLLIKIPGKK